MINPKQFSRLLSALILAFAVLVTPLARPVLAQQTAPAKATVASAPTYTEALAAIETAIEGPAKGIGNPRRLAGDCEGRQDYLHEGPRS